MDCKSSIKTPKGRSERVSKRAMPEIPQAGAAGKEEASMAPQAAARKEPKKERTPRVDWAELLRRTFDFVDVFACVWCVDNPGVRTAADDPAAPVGCPARVTRKDPGLLVRAPLARHGDVLARLADGAEIEPGLGSGPKSEPIT